MKEVVKIHSDDSLYVERLFYEHEAGKDTIAYLMKDKDIIWEALQHYINVVETRFFLLSKAKEEISKKYEPESFSGKKYNYSFNFDTEEIVYELV